MCDESSSFLWMSRTESQGDLKQVFDRVKQTRVVVAYEQQYMTRISSCHFCTVTLILLVLRGQTASKDR